MEHIMGSGSPIHFNATKVIRPKPAPTLGQHTDAILSEVLELTSKI
jgi:crotonobetainyl-CoA:carnitine CoA-transferase CaiB-like acyl-CoA transferase